MDTTVVRRLAIRRMVDAFAAESDETQVDEVLRRADRAARLLARDLSRLQVGPCRKEARHA